MTAPDPHSRAPLVAALGALVCAGAVAVASAGAPPDVAFGRGLLQFLIIAVPIATGLYALRAPVGPSLGIAMLATGFLWSLTALAETSWSVTYTVGRVSTWLVFPCVAYLLLAFPSGRIASRLDRVVLLGVLGVLVLLFLGTAPLVQAFPLNTLWATCTTDCPANALLVLDRQPAFLDELVLVRELLVELLWLGLFWSMLRRWRGASPLQRRAMDPVFLAGAVLGVTHIAFHSVRQLGGSAETVVALSSVWTVGIVAVCSAFLVGIIRRHTQLKAVLAGLGGRTPRANVSPQAAREALATALSESTIEPLFRSGASRMWHDASGRTVEWPQPLAAGRAVTTTADGAGHEVALLHDVALRDDPELLNGVSGIVMAAWRSAETTAELARAMSDLEDSRRRIAQAADVERARIERDLHDGAQQRLIALRIRLGLAEEEEMDGDRSAGAQAMRELGFEAERALDELRSLARGVYPSTLVDRGLADALRSVARQAPIPIRVVARGVTRLAIEIESAVYFTCLEAIQNALKHAKGSTALSVELTQASRSLRFVVQDDGEGFPPGRQTGRGIRNMRDRIEAIGGQLTIGGQPGHGVRISGVVEALAADGSAHDGQGAAPRT